MTTKIIEDENGNVIQEFNNLDDIDNTVVVLNPNNKLVPKKYINNILKTYGVNYKIKNLSIFQRALTHKSFLIKEMMKDENNNKIDKEKFIVIKYVEIRDGNIIFRPVKKGEKIVPLQENAYERLEFLGDSVLHLIVAEYLYKRYPDQDEGFMTRLRTKIENGESLSQLAKIIGLNKYILISSHIESTGGRNNKVNILEDVFESFLGALYLDSNFDTCKKFITQLMEEKINFSYILKHETNFKDTLLRHYHQMQWTDPKYGIYKKNGPDHKKIFTMFVTGEDGKTKVGFGTGPSKRKGEQYAAKQALIYYNVLNEESDSESNSNSESDSESNSESDSEIVSESKFKYK